MPEGPQPSRPDLAIDVLGPLEVRVTGAPVTVRAAQQRAVLASLALAAPHPVLAERLIDALWPEQAPNSARTALHNIIRRLRALLAHAGADDVIETRPDGYRLTVGPDHVDSGRFAQLVEQAVDLTERENFAEAAAAYRLALGLWRGDPLPELTAIGLLATDSMQLVEARVGATEEWVDLQLRIGQPEPVVETLTKLTERFPLRESLSSRLMLALHAAGRTADALLEYSRVRKSLVDELGIEPGASLRAAHEAVLRPDPESEETESARGAARPLFTPAQLPPAPAPLVGRSSALMALDSTLTDDADADAMTCVVSGPAGVGKTSIAVAWARRVADRFPDGQLFVNLRGFDAHGLPLTPHEALRGFLIALGVPDEGIPHDLDAAVGLYRSLLVQRRVLVVLDNARDAGQVRPLLPTSSGCQAVVTSRHVLGGLAVTERAMTISLDLLSAEESEQMLAARLGATRIGSEPAALKEIVGRCAGLPLALAVATAQVASRSDLPLAALADRLRVVASPLDVLRVDDPTIDVRAVFSWSVEALTDDTAAVFRLLGLHPGPDFSLPVAVSITGRSERQTRQAVGELTRAHLVAERATDRAAFHDLIRAHAREVTEEIDSSDLRAAAVRRLLDHYLHSAHAATRALFSTPLPFTLDPPAPGVVPEQFDDAETATQWLETELPVLRKVVELVTRTPGLEGTAWRFARVVNGWLWDHCRWLDMLSLHEAGLVGATSIGDGHGVADTLHGLGDAYCGMRRYAEARRMLERSLAHFRERRDQMGESDVHSTLGRMWEAQDAYPEALHHTRQALAIYQQIADRSGEAVARNNIGWMLAQQGQFADALAQCEEALAINRAEGDQAGQTYALDSVGLAHLGLGHQEQAIACFAEASDLSRRLGQRFNRSENLGHLGQAYAASGDVEAAREAWTSALLLLEGLGHANAESIRDRLASL